MLQQHITFRQALGPVGCRTRHPMLRGDINSIFLTTPSFRVGAIFINAFFDNFETVAGRLIEYYNYALR